MPGNFPAALAAGLAAAVLGAAIWAAITVTTNTKHGLVAVGIGVLVGFAIRFAGRGAEPKFAFAGAAFALFGCVLGNYLTIVALRANYTDTGYVESLIRLASDPATSAELMRKTFRLMDLLFYAIAVYEGFKFSLRR